MCLILYTVFCRHCQFLQTNAATCKECHVPTPYLSLSWKNTKHILTSSPSKSTFLIDFSGSPYLATPRS